MIIYLSDVVSLPGNPPGGSVDGEGNPLTPRNRPAWDTLFGLLNKTGFAVTARFRFWNENDGSPVLWPDGGDHHDVPIQPGRAWAATLIPHNGFDDPPGNFSGHGTIEFLQPSPFGMTPLPDTASVFAWSMLSGGNWDRNSPSCDTPVRKSIPMWQLWLFAYVIPHFENADHPGATGQAYDTGISIQNFSPFPVNITVKYVVNQCYGEDSGRSWSFKKVVPANGGTRFSLCQELWKAGMPRELNSEGHIEIMSDVPAQLYPTAIPTTWDYLWRAAESFAE